MHGVYVKTNRYQDNVMTYAKKLIEVSLPLEAINTESAREKSIRHGHPSTLHLWWARRPLATARAVLWASLVDDPSSHPELFPTEEDQVRERKRLHDLLAELVIWENSGNEELLEEARAEIKKYMGDEKLVFLDPFAGGGSIPLEAQRLGLEAHAHDLNPVAVLINKAMIEIPPRFADMPPVNPEARKILGNDRQWKGSRGLAEDVRYYGEWMKQEAFRRIGHLYPKVQVPAELGGGDATVIAWIWARTVKCPNPACGCEMPLASSFVLSKKAGKEAWVEPLVEQCNDGPHISYIVHAGKCPKGKETNKVGKKGANFKCPACGVSVQPDYVKSEGMAFRMRSNLMAVVAHGEHKRLYLSPDIRQIQSLKIKKPQDYPTGDIAGDRRSLFTPLYGLDTFDKLFTPRQLTALTTFSDLVAEAQRKATEEALAAGRADDGICLADGGRGALAYGQAVGVYLAFVVDKLADYHSSICSWHVTGEKMRNTFARQAIPMVWDYAEGNPFSSSSGCFDNMLEWIVKCLQELPASATSTALQQDAQTDCGLRTLVVSSDPPYYDNIGYADLSDYFYIWLRQSLKKTYPLLFRTMLVPKLEELVATPYRFDGSKVAARQFFEEGMLQACRQIYLYARDDVPVTIYYAYKQSEADEQGDSVQASTGWETMLSAIIHAGFCITGTWPMRTEMTSRSVASNTNALASSIVLVCRKRAQDAPSCTRRTFLAELRRELRPALTRMQTSNIAPVDLAQASIGPGMAVYSRYAKVLEADGSELSIRKALQIINQELDAYFTEQEGAMDEVSRVCIALYSQYAFNELSFGEADVLARAKNTSIAALVRLELASAKQGSVHLLDRPELPAFTARSEESLWLVTQQVVQALQEQGVEGCANIVSSLRRIAPDSVKALAYRLYSLADQKGWTQEAYVYNSLVVAWNDIQITSMKNKKSKLVQGSLV